MITEPPIWDKETATAKFRKIEESNGRGEWLDVDWKTELKWDDTTNVSNTTQRAISGLANSSGGNLVIGFDPRGNLIGFGVENDIENTIQRKLERRLSRVPLFKAEYFEYKSKNVLVISIAPSREPIRCDNGVYYYRSQSEF